MKRAGIAIAGVFLALLWLEHRRPLRPRVEPQSRRLAANLRTGVQAALTVALLEEPVVQRLSASVERHRIGLVPMLQLRPATSRLLQLMLLDYTLYLWHHLLHRAPVLWRWHRVHHADADLDVSTALRFHAMELLWSLPWRMAQVVLIGVAPRVLKLWGQLTLAEVMFHHSNLRLPGAVERILGEIVVTPGQHGVHHANSAQLQHSNLSSGLALWDRLHGTRRVLARPGEVTVGLPPPPDQASR